VIAAILRKLRGYCSYAFWYSPSECEARVSPSQESSVTGDRMPAEGSLLLLEKLELDPIVQESLSPWNTATKSKNPTPTA